MFLDIYNKILEFDTIIIHRHIRPDGDCIGSQMGLKAALKATFPAKHIYAVGDNIPSYLLEIGTNDEVEDSLYENALVIVVDTSTPDRICDARWQTGKYIIKIDHHDDSPFFGNLEYVDASSPACSSIITTFIRSLDGKIKMPQDAAYALYLGITTDTGRFKYRGVDNTVFNNAGYLVSTGIDIEKLYNNLYIEDAATLHLQGYVLTHFKLTENGVAYIYFTKKLMAKYGVKTEDASNLVNSLSSIRNSLIWVAFIEQDNPEKTEIRCRLRSRFVAINSIAAAYHGGGHLQASGATVYSTKEMHKLLKDLDAALKEYKEQNPNVF